MAGEGGVREQRHTCTRCGARRALLLSTCPGDIGCPICGVGPGKPPGFLELVEQITDGPRMELFAREARLGWDSWGDEALHGTEAMAV